MTRFSIVIVILSLCFVFIWSTLSSAHQLSVFAWVEGDSVLVEARLPKGKHPKLGDVLVYDGEDHLLLKTRLLPDGPASFPLENWKTGYRIIVDIGHAHWASWILTPYDIQQQINDQQ